MLKYFVKDLNEIDEKFHSLYEKNGDGYHLKVEGVVPKTKLNEFRENNIKLMKKISALEEKINQYGADPEDVKKWKEELEQLKSQKSSNSEPSIEEVIAQRTQQMKKAYDDKLKELTSRLDEIEAEKQKYREQVLKTKLQETILKSVSSVSKVRESAKDDILLRAERVFTFDEEGNIVARTSDGQTLYGSDGISPLTPEEWAKSLVQEAPHLFEESKGSGGVKLPKDPLQLQNEVFKGSVDLIDKLD